MACVYKNKLYNCFVNEGIDQFVHLLSMPLLSLFFAFFEMLDVQLISRPPEKVWCQGNNTNDTTNGGSLKHDSFQKL